jgi:ubiquitin conjugation factor E4 B
VIVQSPSDHSFYSLAPHLIPIALPPPSFNKTPHNMADEQPPPPPPQDMDPEKVQELPHGPPKRVADEDLSQIRAKRLAKLDGPANPNGSSQPASATPSAPASSSSSPKPTEAQAPPPKPQPSPAPAANPFSQLGMQSEAAPKPRINIKPKPAHPSSSGTPPPPATKAQDNISIEAWEDRTISGIFRITLDQGRTQDTHGHKLYHASATKDDLEADGKPMRFTTDMLDSVILESASSHSQGSALEYLLSCWKRVSKQFKSFTNKSDPKFEIVKEARRLCFSYCVFAATMPDMFGEEAPPTNALADHILLGPDDDRGICYEFLTEASNRMGEDDSIKEALVGAMEDVSRRLAKVSMNGDYRPYMLVLRVFIRFPPLVAALAQSETFLPANIEAQQIETSTFLGPFFRLSPMQGDVALNYFAGSASQDKGLTANAQRALRMTLQTHQDELLDITNAFIKNKESREKMLDWFAMTVNKNHKRRAIQVDPKIVSSDGFMVNVTVILDRLCEPFMDASFSKIDRIEVDYLRRTPRVDIKDETKINADDKAAEEFYSQSASGTNNFISEVFFLTVAAHHYGTEAANSKLSNLQKDVKWLTKELVKIETERHKYASNPMQLQVFENHVKKIKDQIERGQCTILAIQGVLLDETIQARSMQLMRYVIVWLLRLASPGTAFPKQELQLPLSAEQSTAFKCLPEYFVEDIVGNFKFITRWMPHIVTSTQCEELVKICITLLRNSEYIKNPYLKSGLVTILFHGVWAIPGRPKGVLGDTLFAHNFATKHLLHSLMKFYIECESTGTHTQFYDKFNIRYEIFQVIKCIWPNTMYRENLATEARYVYCSALFRTKLTSSQGQLGLLRPIRQPAAQRRYVRPRRIFHRLQRDPRDLQNPRRLSSRHGPNPPPRKRRKALRRPRQSQILHATHQRNRCHAEALHRSPRRFFHQEGSRRPPRPHARLQPRSPRRPQARQPQSQKPRRIRLEPAANARRSHRRLSQLIQQAVFHRRRGD